MIARWHFFSGNLNNFDSGAKLGKRNTILNLFNYRSIIDPVVFAAGTSPIWHSTHLSSGTTLAGPIRFRTSRRQSEKLCQNGSAIGVGWRESKGLSTKWTVGNVPRFQNIAPMHTVWEDQECPTFEDVPEEALPVEEVFRNAAVRFDDFFVTPPGNVPLESAERFDLKVINEWDRIGTPTAPQAKKSKLTENEWHCRKQINED